MFFGITPCKNAIAIRILLFHLNVYVPVATHRPLSTTLKSMSAGPSNLLYKNAGRAEILLGSSSPPFPGLLVATDDAAVLNITNSCSYTVWPAATPGGGGRSGPSTWPPAPPPAACGDAPAAPLTRAALGSYASNCKYSAFWANREEISILRKPASSCRPAQQHEQTSSQVELKLSSTCTDRGRDAEQRAVGHSPAPARRQHLHVCAAARPRPVCWSARSPGSRSCSAARPGAAAVRSPA
ncbi:hypothetical protein BS78_03G157200 [Paspalum vaginatum]|nr:hypothetical protein BS78_03G157200 [Paspalum vaginatum]